MHQPSAVYLLTDKRHSTLYTGITSNLPRRVRQHRLHNIEGFTKRYDSAVLVYYEFHHSADSALKRKRELKNSSRKRKIQLIESINPRWADLYIGLLQ